VSLDRKEQSISEVDRDLVTGGEKYLEGRKSIGEEVFKKDFRSSIGESQEWRAESPVIRDYQEGSNRQPDGSSGKLQLHSISFADKNEPKLSRFEEKRVQKIEKSELINTRGAELPSLTLSERVGKFKAEEGVSREEWNRESLKEKALTHHAIQKTKMEELNEALGMRSLQKKLTKTLEVYDKHREKTKAVQDFSYEVRKVKKMTKTTQAHKGSSPHTPSEGVPNDISFRDNGTDFPIHGVDLLEMQREERKSNLISGEAQNEKGQTQSPKDSGAIFPTASPRNSSPRMSNPFRRSSANSSRSPRDVPSRIGKALEIAKTIHCTPKTPFNRTNVPMQNQPTTKAPSHRQSSPFTQSRTIVSQTSNSTTSKRLPPGLAPISTTTLTTTLKNKTKHFTDVSGQVDLIRHDFCKILRDKEEFLRIQALERAAKGTRVRHYHDVHMQRNLVQGTGFQTISVTPKPKP
jgi:hypothetical protein